MRDRLAKDIRRYAILLTAGKPWNDSGGQRNGKA